jgi:hypothetical protein
VRELTVRDGPESMETHASCFELVELMDTDHLLHLLEYSDFV